MTYSVDNSLRLKPVFEAIPATRSTLGLLLTTFFLFACDSSSDGDTQGSQQECNASIEAASCNDGVEASPAGAQDDGPVSSGTNVNLAPPDVPNGFYLPGSPNTAILSGPVFGQGDISNDIVLKSLNHDIDEIGTDLRIVEFKAVNNDPGASLIGIVENTGEDYICTARIKGISTYATDGRVLQSAIQVDPVFIAGGTGSYAAEFGRRIYSNCIGPGSFGYLRDTGTTSFEDVAEVRGEAFTKSRGNEFRPESIPVVPVSYVVGRFGVDVLIVNRHTTAVNVTQIFGVALDEDGYALSLSSTPVSGSVRMEPGDEVVARDLLNQFEGQASSLRVIVDVNIVYD